MPPLITELLALLIPLYKTFCQLPPSPIEILTHQIIVIGVAAIVPHNALADSLMEEISQFMETATEAQILEETREVR